MPPALRPMAPADVAACAALTAAHPLFARYPLAPERLAVALERAHAAGERLVLAASDDGPLGFAWWLPDGAFARSPYLRLLVVAAGATGRGIGSALMDDVERTAFALAPDLFALVNAANVSARRFYARRGFAEVGTLAGYVAPGVDEVVLRLRRPSPPAP